MNPSIDHALGELVDRRAGLVATERRTPRQDADLAELTEVVEQHLGEGSVVRRLSPDDPLDRTLAEDLGAREKINPVRSPEDLQRRLATDRAVYVVEHPGLPARPLSVLWVALCKGLPDRLEQILAPDAPVVDPASATAAVFYSIWATEKIAFRGIGQSSLLLSAAAADIESTHPCVGTQCTMSPVPGYRRWVGENTGTAEPSAHPPDHARACARYLTTFGDDGRLLDPVARLHLGNGARLWRVLAGADTSAEGRERAFGTMANYRYRPEDLDANKQQLAAGTVPVGEQVATLVELSSTATDLDARH
ncbi:MAG: malonyl-CoA decarboxylase domain-containing protein [Microthrixaceae bacterium]